jgi:hypothetical protein
MEDVFACGRVRVDRERPARALTPSESRNLEPAAIPDLYGWKRDPRASWTAGLRTRPRSQARSAPRFSIPPAAQDTADLAARGPMIDRARFKLFPKFG